MYGIIYDGKSWAVIKNNIIIIRFKNKHIAYKFMEKIKKDIDKL